MIINLNNIKVLSSKSILFNKKDFEFGLFLGTEVGLLSLIILRYLKPDLTNITLKNISIPIWTVTLFLPIFSLIAIWVIFKIGSRAIIIAQMGKFIFVGTGNTLVDFFILNSLIEFKIPETTYMRAFYMAVSFLLSMIHSFILNKFWTFQKKETKKTGQEFGLFLFISLIGIIVHSTIATGSANLFILKNILSKKLCLNIGKIVGIGFSLVWNFTGYKLIVFNN